MAGNYVEKLKNFRGIVERIAITAKTDTPLAPLPPIDGAGRISQSAPARVRLSPDARRERFARYQHYVLHIHAYSPHTADKRSKDAANRVFGRSPYHIHRGAVNST